MFLQVETYSCLLYFKFIFDSTLCEKHSSFSEEVHLEQITASVEPQEVVISSIDANAAISYAIRSSKPGSRVEVIIEDGSTNSSQGLCHNVEVLYSSGKYYKLTMVSLRDLEST